MIDLGTQLAPVKECGKRTYASKTVARKLAKRVNDSGKSRVHPYHCTKCHGWHLGTADFYAQSRAVRRKRRSVTET